MQPITTEKLATLLADADIHLADEMMEGLDSHRQPRDTITILLLAGILGAIAASDKEPEVLVAQLMVVVRSVVNIDAPPGSFTDIFRKQLQRTAPAKH